MKHNIYRLIKKHYQIKHDVFLLVMLTLSAYIKNLSPSVYGGDSGDILTAAVVNGVAHPSGYPLQTILGIIFLKLPFISTPAWKIGLVSAIFSSLTVVVIYFTVLELTKRRLLGFLTALTVAFTYSFWLYAEVAEVFALHSFFISLLVFFTIKYSLNPKPKFLYLIAFIAGLSLTNNQSIIIIFPFIALTILIKTWRVVLNYKLIIKCIILVLAGLIPYIYIPIAAKQNPAMNWGFATNIENFWFLITRQYYGWGEGVETLKANYTISNIINRMSVYLDYWKSYINPLIPLVSILGIIELLKEKKLLILTFIMLSFLFFGPLFMIVAGSDFKSYLGLAIIERFLISNIVISFLFFPFGVIFLERLIGNIKYVRNHLKIFLQQILLALLFLIPLVSFYVNYKRTDLSNVFIGDNLALSVLSTLPPNSVLMLRNDTIAFNTIYYQEAYNFRKDIQIPGMHNGFELNLKVIGMKDDEINAHILKNKGGINKRIFDQSIRALLDDNVNVFIDGIYTIENADTDNEKIVTIPLGLLYKFEYYENLPYPKETYLNTVSSVTKNYKTDDFSNHPEVMANSLILSDVKKLYSADFYRISEYLNNQYKDKENTIKFLIQSFKLDPFTDQSLPLK